MLDVINIPTMLHRVYEVAAWHGPTIKKSLENVSVEKAIRRFEGCHNIAELVHHMTAWRIFAIKKLQGEDEFDVADDFNFVPYHSLTAEEWQALLDRLDDSQKTLLDLVNNMPDEQLWKMVSKRTYNFYELLHGIIQHDTYHAGQIVLLKK